MLWTPYLFYVLAIFFSTTDLADLTADLIYTNDFLSATVALGILIISATAFSYVFPCSTELALTNPSSFSASSF